MVKVSREILIRYGEIFLKSEPVFKRFERKLRENIIKTLKRGGIKFQLKKERGRIFLLAKEERKAIEELKKIFGIVSISPVYHLETSQLHLIKDFCEKEFKNFLKKRETFAIRAKRIGRHSYQSQDLEREIGKVVKGKVNLKNPKKEIFLEVRQNDTYVFTEIIPTLGGLPISVSGKVISLLSGGIDSPVAAWLTMKRGCQAVFLHFHSFPLVSKKSIEKCQEIIKQLNQYQLKSKLIILPFQKIQILYKTKVAPKNRIILYRRSMMRIAEKIAKIENSQALVTGESLAQVSSQTLPNLAVIEEAVKIPIFRPLLGMDKVEIINLAKKIGTYEISILPQEDCCSLFVPKHPSTRADLEIIKSFEKKIEIKKLEKVILKEREEVFI